MTDVTDICESESDAQLAGAEDTLEEDLGASRALHILPTRFPGVLEIKERLNGRCGKLFL